MVQNAYKMPEIRSVTVPYGYQLELYNNFSYDEPVEVIKSKATFDQDDFLPCHEITNTDYTNIAFRKISDFEATGHWVQSKYNGDIDTHMQTGYYSVDNAQYWQAQIDIWFYTKNMKFDNVTLSSENLEVELFTIHNALTSRSNTQTVLCEAEDDMAALYQWVVTIDGYTVHTDHFVCRSGAAAWEFPACPDSACEDDQCNSCIEGWQNSNQ